MNCCHNKIQVHEIIRCHENDENNNNDESKNENETKMKRENRKLEFRKRDNDDRKTKLTMFELLNSFIDNTINDDVFFENNKVSIIEKFSKKNQLNVVIDFSLQIFDQKLIKQFKTFHFENQLLIIIIENIRRK